MGKEPAFTPLLLATQFLEIRKHTKKAFTLAEVLITIGVIGVVAALTIPIVLANINEQARSEREANIAFKVTQAMDKMRALGLLSVQYPSTYAFAQELQKHLAIAKLCDENNIKECWPSQKITTAEGKEFEVARAKKGKNLQYRDNVTGNVGIVMADGATLIMTYNTTSEPVDDSVAIIASNKTLPLGFGRTKDFAYTTNSTSAIDFVMDVNGANGPNSEARNGQLKDIRSFKAARFSTGCNGSEAGDYCVVLLGSSYRAINTCDGSADKSYDSKGSRNTYCANNRWAGAKKACANAGMKMPTTSDYNAIYNANTPGLDKTVGYWADSESGDSEAYPRAINPYYLFFSYGKNYNHPVMCVAKD